jgi:signal peptidase II
MIYWLLILFIVLIDQWSKKKALSFLNKHGGPYKLGKRLQLQLAKNTGSFYGMLKGKKKLIIVVNLFTIIGCVVLLYLGIQDEKSSYNLGFSFLLGGAIGNLIDRIKKGYVIDFIFFKVKRGPIFNLADVFILIGALILCYYEIFYGIF